MNILLASEYFFPHWTGISKAFEALANHLIAEGYSVSVITTQFRDDLKQHEEYKGITIERFKPIGRISRTHYAPSLVIGSLPFIKKAQTVIINSPNSNILFLVILAKLLGKSVYIFHQGDLNLPRQSGSRIFHTLLERVFDLFTIIAMTLSDGVSTYTADYARSSRVMRFFMHKFRAYIPPHHLSKNKTVTKTQKTLQKLQETHSLIGFAGRFVEEKGFDILFKAIPHIITTHPNTLFVFAGETNVDYEPFFEKNRALIESVKKHLVFVGLLDEDELSDFYTNLDVFVIPSRSDCFPLTQMEAVAAGVPIVVTDIPGARMLVKETGYGQVVKPNDPRALARGIEHVLQHRSDFTKKKPHVTQFLKSYDRFFPD